ncbi:hypothetical protein ABW20_dc0107756 [Dactylellina cionopaga]|nr:hypothetical protein ABW20_dc0107756 [Dactylellina cionopaga]
MAEFLSLPNELLAEILTYVETPRDIIQIALTCKALYDFVLPIAYRSIAIAVPYCLPDRWDVERAFSEIPKAQVQYLRQIEINYFNDVFMPKPWYTRIAIKPQRKNSKLQKFKDFIRRPSLDFNVVDTSQELFEVQLRQFLQMIPPGQLQKFR